MGHWFLNLFLVFIRTDTYIKMSSKRRFGMNRAAVLWYLKELSVVDRLTWFGFLQESNMAITEVVSSLV